MNEKTLDIKKLPNKILLKILKLVPENFDPETNKRRNNLKYNDLMLVCLRWKCVLERALLFDTNAFFYKERTDEELGIVLESRRKYERLLILTQSFNENHLEEFTEIARDSTAKIATVVVQGEINEFYMHTLFTKLKLSEIEKLHIILDFPINIDSKWLGILISPSIS